MTQWALSGGHKACGARESEACLAYCAPISAESRSMKKAARRAVIPCADKLEAGICSRLRRVRAAERRKSTERLFPDTAHSGSRRAAREKVPMTEWERYRGAAASGS